MSQRDLAQRLGVSTRTVVRWEAGVHRIGPVSERLIRILAEAKAMEKPES